MGSPQQQGSGEAPGHVPGMGGHTQVQLPGAGAALTSGGISGFAEIPAAEKAFLLCRGVGR